MKEWRRRGRSVITGASTKLLCIGPRETDTGWSIQHTLGWKHTHTADVMQAHGVSSVTPRRMFIIFSPRSVPLSHADLSYVVLLNIETSVQSSGHAQPNGLLK